MNLHTCDLSPQGIFKEKKNEEIAQQVFFLLQELLLIRTSKKMYSIQNRHNTN
jgi:ribosomal protein L29